MGTRWEAAAKIQPTNPPISNPPTLDKTSRPSSGSGQLTSIACLITLILFLSWFSSIPVPRPVTSSTLDLVKQATIALLGVVFAIPISPNPIMSIPFLFNSSSNTSIPAIIALSASSLLMAGPLAILFVP